ncbi:MAG: transglutaminase protein [Rhodospirillales bacterium]|nr:transglutaminase protein [Rhodospirillales bacterium]
MNPDFLRHTDVIDHHQPAVAAKAVDLARNLSSDTAVAHACFLYVRDTIRHSSDHQLNPVTCRASDVLEHGTGYCFAKSHLLAALLRANNIPVGFCYQRLSINDVGPPYTLHGFNAVYLNEYGWYRVDARGCTAGITSEFTPPFESLAYTPKLQGEADLPEIWTDPLSVVVRSLARSANWKDALNHLPDIELSHVHIRLTGIQQ